MKKIKEYKHHYIDTEGNVYSNYNGVINKLKTFYDRDNRYEYIVISENAKRKHHAIHRLVAEAFVPNPLDYPEIHHKDNDTHNNHVDNLEWCTRQYNVKQSYKTMPSNRNYVSCDLYKNDKFIKNFNGIKPAAEYAAEVYGVSYSSLAKYLHSQDVCIYCK